MHKIGIISDTHGMLRPEVLDVLKKCELIFHGGDINRQEILDELSAIAPVYAVRGNNDSIGKSRYKKQADSKKDEWAEHLPETLALDVFGLRVFMVHDKKSIPENLAGFQLVIYGHSHKYEEKYADGVWYLNPGSCGPGRFHQEISMSVVYIEDSGNIRIKKIVFPVREKIEERVRGNEKKIKNEIPVDIAVVLPAIMREIDAGKSVKQIARKHQISEELSAQINRMYLTHPGVDVDGILNRLGTGYF